MAAFRTVVNGGLIPHARHGGRCVPAVAVAGSKFDGTGLENVQIGHIHVALTGLGEGAWCGAADCGRGDCGFTGCRVDACGKAGLAVALRALSGLPFCGLGYIVIFAEDFKKPACNAARQLSHRHIMQQGLAPTWYSARSISFRSIPMQYLRGSSAEM